MFVLKNPSWIDNRLLSVNSVEDFPDDIYYEINKSLGVLQSDAPLVSVVIPAFNEEVNIVRTIYYLARSKTSFGVEFIVVNNNSTDRTADVLRRINVKTYFQPRPGCGPARQMGQEMAQGKYVLMADADCFYPPTWIQTMTKALEEKDVTCVYGRYSFLGTEDKPRWQLFVYESLRDSIAELRHIKRPYMNALGMSMGYTKEFGLKVRFVDRKIRGEDGRMCFGLMQLGKVKQVRDSDIRVWTLPRTLDKEGNLFNAVLARATVELSRFRHYFTKHAPHDVHTSENYSTAALKHFKKYKQVHKDKEPV